MQRQDLQAAYLLHTRPHKEQHLLLDVFTHKWGRVRVMARSVRRDKSRKRALLQPFKPLLLSWFGRGDLYTLSAVEEQPKALPLLQADALYCGFYCNELLMHFLALEDPEPKLYALYETTLEQLAAGQEPQLLLRPFERALLYVAGLGMALNECADSGRGVQPGQRYAIHPYRGVFADLTAAPQPHMLIEGRVLQALAGDSAALDGVSEKSLRDTMRWLLRCYLQGRDIHSRALFRSPIKT